MKTYEQLTEGQRYQIYALKKARLLKKDIATIIGTSSATIGREIKRNSGKRGYRPRQAQIKADRRKQLAAKSLKMKPEVIELIESQIRFDLSPEQTSNVLKQEHGLYISHERIYQHIWTDKRKGGDLYTHLRHGKKRRKKYASKDKRGQIANRVSIDERPKIVDDKSRIGDWEIDTVIGKNHRGALVTIVERKTMFTLIKKVGSKHAEVVTSATIELLQPYGDRVCSITADNGKEFSGHEIMSEALNTDVYFARPYSSWERGLNENTNGLIRQYFPKGSSFDEITDEQVEFVMHRLNNRPRKGLNYQTPNTVFFGQPKRKTA